MSTKQCKPSWWVLYALLVLMIVAFVFESKDGLPPWANQVADIGIVLVVFGAMALWVRLNLSALTAEEFEQAGSEEWRVEEYLPQEFSNPSPNETDGTDANPISH